MGFSTRWRILGWKRDQDWCIDLQYDSAKCLTTAVFMFFTYFGIDWDIDGVLADRGAFVSHPR